MAAFNTAADKSASFQRRLSALDRPSSSSSSPATRRGPCNYRDLNVGHKCGCITFWEDEGRRARNLGADAIDEHNAREYCWCICGHHACYHHVTEAQPRADNLAALGPTSQLSRGQFLHGQDGMYLQLVQKPEKGAWKGKSRLQEIGTTVGSGAPRASTPRFNSSQAPEDGYHRPRSAVFASFPNAPNVHPDDNGAMSATANASSLPRSPSIYGFNSAELRHSAQAHERPRTTPPHAMTPPRATRTSWTPRGLGLALGVDTRPILGGAQPSGHPYAPYSQKRNESQRPQSRASSRTNNLRRSSPNPSFIQAVFEQNHRGPPSVDMESTIPDPIPINPDDIIQSATEVATPSNNNSPAMSPFDQNVNEAQQIVQLLSRELAEEQPASTTANNDEQQNQDDHSAQPRHCSNFAALSEGEHRSSPHPPNRSSHNPQAELNVSNPSIQSALSRLAICLNSIQTQVGAFPNVPATIRMLAERIEGLEGMSFERVHPDELQDKLDFVDGRLIDLETFRDDHEKHHTAMEAENSLRDQVGPHNDPNRSFHSQASHSSAATVPNVQDELADIKDRLDDLEDKWPSSTRPWNVEVVLIPWGPRLRGIWLTPDETEEANKADEADKQVPWTAITQDTEEWTQILNQRPSSKAPLSSISSFQSGWSKEDIEGWAENVQTWFSPRSCGTKNLVYKRLQSRGFVRNVTLTSPNATDILREITKCFRPLLDTLAINANVKLEEDEDTEQMLREMPGLGAPVIPLRKILHSSRLRFLSQPEMSTSALWTARFLAAGVLMRVSGGVKRLFVTQRDAYMQQELSDDSGWTWQRLRDLPCFNASEEEAMEGVEGSSQVDETDDKEPCWGFCPYLDEGPVSRSSSFVSYAADSKISSSQRIPPVSPTATRPFSRQSGSRSHQRQHSQSSNKQQGKPPPSPLSEFPPNRHGSMLRSERGRTASASAVEQDIFPTTNDFKRSTSGKRRSSASYDTTLGPRPTPKPSSTLRRSSNSLKKRRLISSSPDPLQQEDISMYDDELAQGQVANRSASQGRAYGLTPRRSKEPTSPYLRHAALPGPSTAPAVEVHRMQVAAPNGVPYATPHSGTGHRFHQDEDIYSEGDTVPDSEMEWAGLDDVEMVAQESRRSVAGANNPQSDEGFAEDDDYDEAERDVSLGNGSESPEQEDNQAFVMDPSDLDESQEMDLDSSISDDDDDDSDDDIDELAE